MSKCGCYTFKHVLDHIFVDEDSHFDPDIADSSSVKRPASERNGLARGCGNSRRFSVPIFHSGDTSNVPFFIFY